MYVLGFVSLALDEKKNAQHTPKRILLRDGVSIFVIFCHLMEIGLRGVRRAVSTRQRGSVILFMQSGGYYIISPTQGQGENGWV